MKNFYSTKDDDIIAVLVTENMTLQDFKDIFDNYYIRSLVTYENYYDILVNNIPPFSTYIPTKIPLNSYCVKWDNEICSYTKNELTCNFHDMFHIPYFPLVWEQIYQKSPIGDKNEWRANTPGLLWDYYIIESSPHNFRTYHYDEQFDDSYETLEDAQHACQEDIHNVLDSLEDLYN